MRNPMVLKKYSPMVTMKKTLAMRVIPQLRA
jgi:hypothetical protein